MLGILRIRGKEKEIIKRIEEIEIVKKKKVKFLKKKYKDSNKKIIAKVIPKFFSLLTAISIFFFISDNYIPELSIISLILFATKKLPYLDICPKYLLSLILYNFLNSSSPLVK